MNRIFGLRPFCPLSSGAIAPTAAPPMNSLRVFMTLSFREPRREHHALRTHSQFAALQEWLAALGKVLYQPLPPSPQIRFMAGIAGQVRQLIWIAPQIEELLFAVPGVENVFPAAVGESVPMIFRAIADVVFEVDILTPAAARIPNQREQAAPVDLAIERGGRRFHK